jgi:Kef-type K+ transport system membrane component KefB
MQITEPVTMLTDYALAAVSWVFAFLIGRLIGPRNRVSAWFWCAAFVASGVAAASGGTYHGFAKYLDAGSSRSLWNLTVYLMGATAAFVTAGIHSAHIRREDGTVQWLAAAILVTILGLAVQQSGFPRYPNFNHNDAYHLIQIVGLYFLYRCGLTLRDRPGIPN